MAYQLLARIGDGSVQSPVPPFLSIGLLLLLAGWGLYEVWERNRKMNLYDDAYAAFVANPLDSSLRENARECANQYASALLKPASDRNLQRTSFFNDIDNVYRTAKGQEKLRKKIEDNKPTRHADRLAELQKMFDQGLISEEEFQTKRTQILNEF
ncbi:MAG TPA: SHOCT domain-containing protein [Fimbriimonas sp.]|nr:SHOCT domain-containing protein [Fimbriimonas sp.]